MKVVYTKEQIDQIREVLSQLPVTGEQGIMTFAYVFQVLRQGEVIQEEEAE
jgi:hypothetical protein